MSPDQRKKIALAFPELAPSLMQEATSESLKRIAAQYKFPPELIAKIKSVKGEKGEKGDKGDSFFGSDGKDGKDGREGKNGKDGDKGEKGDRGPRGLDGLDGKDGKKGVDGKDGKDAKLDVDKVIDPLNKRIDEISNTLSAKGKIDQRWHGGGLSRVSTDSTLTGQGTPSNPLSVVGTGTGTVTSVSVSTANGVSGSVATATTTPAITLQVGQVTKSIAQTAHGFSVGTVIRYNGTTYVTSKADAASNAEVDGMVSVVTDANNFILTSIGYITGLSGLVAGTTYFLSQTTAGTITATEPTTAGQVSKPVFRAVTTTAGYFIDYRGITVASGGGTGITRSVNVISSNTSAGATAAVDYVYLVSGTTTLTLPTAVGNTNMYTVKNTGSNTVTIATTSAQTIDGSVGITLTATPANQSRDFISDNANWQII